MKIHLVKSGHIVYPIVRTYFLKYVTPVKVPCFEYICLFFRSKIFFRSRWSGNRFVKSRLVCFASAPNPAKSIVCFLFFLRTEQPDWEDYVNRCFVKDQELNEQIFFCWLMSLPMDEMAKSNELASITAICNVINTSVGTSHQLSFHEMRKIVRLNVSLTIILSFCTVSFIFMFII